MNLLKCLLMFVTTLSSITITAATATSARPSLASQHQHECQFIKRLRAFKVCEALNGLDSRQLIIPVIYFRREVGNVGTSTTVSSTRIRICKDVSRRINGRHSPVSTTAATTKPRSRTLYNSRCQINLSALKIRSLVQ